MRLGLAAATAILLWTSSAHADRTWKRRYVHIAAVGVGTAVFLVTELPLKDNLAPEACRWCATNGLDAGVRSALVWDEPTDALLISDIGAFVLAPAVTIGLLWSEGWPDRDAGRFLDDALPVLEATFALAAITQATKFAVGRERPFVHHADPGRPVEDDDYLSFYSGHTGTAFAIATSAGTVARLRGYRLEPVIWAAGLTIAATTGYLRIAGDKHWFSDVVVGAAVGSAIGLTLPRVFHGRNLTLMPARDGVVLSGLF